MVPTPTTTQLLNTDLICRHHHGRFPGLPLHYVFTAPHAWITGWLFPGRTVTGHRFTHGRGYTHAAALERSLFWTAACWTPRLHATTGHRCDTQVLLRFALFYWFVTATAGSAVHATPLTPHAGLCQLDADDTTPSPAHKHRIALLPRARFLHCHTRTWTGQGCLGRTHSTCLPHTTTNTPAAHAHNTSVPVCALCPPATTLTYVLQPAFCRDLDWFWLYRLQHTRAATLDVRILPCLFDRFFTWTAALPSGTVTRTTSPRTTPFALPIAFLRSFSLRFTTHVTDDSRLRTYRHHTHTPPFHRIPAPPAAFPC